MNKPIKTIKGEENTEIRVFKIDSGYSVTVYDCDAEMTYPTILIFKTEEAVIEYAGGE